MKNNKLVITAILSFALLSAILGAVFFPLKVSVPQKQNEALGSAIYNTVPTVVAASSTAYSITTSSQRVLASSTPTRRLAVTFQTVNCTAAQPLFLLANRDVAATANTGFALYASTTLRLSDYPDAEVPQGAVTAIAPVGTCTLLVTEWRSQY